MPDKLKKICDELGIEYFGIANTEKGSCVVCLFPYYTGCEPGNLPAYAAVQDYHRVVKKYLEKIGGALGVPYICYADVSPFDEVKLASRAGLGVIGKNGLLINEKYGSYVFVGEILLENLILSESGGTDGECLNCGECVRACPSGGIFDKSRCISHISQKKGELSPEETEILKKGRLVWGCDICMEACPMNKNICKTKIPEFCENIKSTLAKDELEGLSEREFKRKFSDRAFTWRGKKVLVRNFGIMEEENEI